MNLFFALLGAIGFLIPILPMMTLHFDYAILLSILKSDKIIITRLEKKLEKIFDVKLNYHDDEKANDEEKIRKSKSKSDDTKLKNHINNDDSKMDPIAAVASGFPFLIAIEEENQNNNNNKQSSTSKIQHQQTMMMPKKENANSDQSSSSSSMISRTFSKIQEE